LRAGLLLCRASHLCLSYRFSARH